MSASTSSTLSVLLPAAVVGVFSNHEETRNAVAALASDWRFARIKFDIRGGDVASALQIYSSSPSPNLLILDTDVIDSSFTAMLEQLASICTEGTEAVVVGPVNDVALYRYLINLGVEDYLVRPLQTPTIADVIGRILLKQLGTSDSQLIAVVGSKGGVGTSIVAEMLACGITERNNQKAILLNVAGGRSYLPVSFGLEPVTTLLETARAAQSSDPSALARMLLKVGNHLQILGTGNDKVLDDNISADHIERILDRFLAVTPYVVFDLSGAPPSVQKLVLSRAPQILVVSWPTLPSLRLARTLTSEIKDLKGGQGDMISLVLNMVGFAPGAEISRLDIEQALSQKIDVSIPFEPRLVIGAESQAKVLGTQKGAERIVSELLSCINVQNRPADEAKPGTGFLDSLFRKGKG